MWQLLKPTNGSYSHSNYYYYFCYYFLTIHLKFAQNISRRQKHMRLLLKWLRRLTKMPLAVKIWTHSRRGGKKKPIKQKPFPEYLTKSVSEETVIAFWHTLLNFTFRVCLCVCAHAHKRLIAQSCPTLCDFTDCSLPGSSIHGILQERILEGVAILFSRGSSPPRDQTHVSYTAGRFFTFWATREAIPWSRI